MHNYDYATKWQKLLTPEIVSMLTQIHEYKGGQISFAEVKEEILTQLIDEAKIQSIEASNKMEDIYISGERLKKLVKDKTRPRTRNEEEIAGYRDVLNVIHESYDHIPPKASIILQLHRDLYKYEGYDIGGKFKSNDRVNGGKDEYENGMEGFSFVSSWETPEAVEALCQKFEETLDEERMEPLLLIPMFILDFLCIHPFDGGNVRMSRLLMLLLLRRAGYIVGEYISIEKLIEDTKVCYYENLQKSSEGWYENRNDYGPFVEYMLGIVLTAYREFSTRVRLLAYSGLSKPDRVSRIIENASEAITKGEIMEKCPDISLVTVQRALGELVVSGKVIKIGGGRYTKYIWNGERNK